MYYDVIMAGFGGQGILLIGDILSQTAMKEGKHVTWMPSYGVEMRGGTANCTVVVSDRRIGSPITGNPGGVIAMNGPALEKFAPRIKPGGLLIANISLADPELLKRNDLDALFLPCFETAVEAGDSRAASMVALGAFIAKTGIISFNEVFKTIEDFLSGKKAKFIPLNIDAVKRGAELAGTVF